MPDIHDRESDAKGKKKQTEKDRIMDELQVAREALTRKKQEKPVSKSAAAQVPAEKTPVYIAQHKVVSGDTMSGLALKYYGSAVKEKWMAIYEANKETIGENPAFIKVGQVLNIPELPE